MKIKVSSQEKPRYEEEVEFYSLTYNFKSAEFEMQAGDHLIPASQRFNPIHLHVQWTTLFVGVEKSEEAEAFCSWLKRASGDAEYSFTHMLD